MVGATCFANQPNVDLSYAITLDDKELTTLSSGSSNSCFRWTVQHRTDPSHGPEIVFELARIDGADCGESFNWEDSPSVQLYCMGQTHRERKHKSISDLPRAIFE